MYVNVVFVIRCLYSAVTLTQSEEGTAPRLPLADFVTTRHVTRTFSVVLLQQSQEVFHFLGDGRFSQGL